MQEKTITLICTNCEEPFEKDIQEYKRRQHKLPGNKNFFCNLSCTASYRNKNNPNNGSHLEPQYGNQYRRIYPQEVAWYAHRCFRDGRCENMPHDDRLQFANHILDKWKEKMDGALLQRYLLNCGIETEKHDSLIRF